MKLEFSRNFSKNTQTSNFMQIRVFPLGQTHGWTGMTKLIAAFRNFANAPKKIKQDRKCTIT